MIRGVHKVAVGAQHTLALMHEGMVMAWGENEDGQLGLGSGEDKSTPQVVELQLKGKRCIDIACGAYHSMAVTSRGALWVWGAGKDGQLGIGTLQVRRVATLVTQLAGQMVVSCAGGESHSAVILENNTLYTWGSSAMGKLGHGMSSNTQHLPRLVKGELRNKHVVQVRQS